MKHLSVLNHYFIKYKWHFGGGLLFVSLSTLFGTYQGILIKDATDEIIRISHSEAQADAWIFVKLAGTMIAFALISGFFMFMMRQTIIVMSRHIEFDQKNEIYQHYQQLDAGFYKRHTTGDLMNRISEDVGRVRMYTGPAIMYIANTIVTTVTILIFMFRVNVSLTLLVFLPLPILSFIIYKVSSLIAKQSTKVQEELSGLTSVTQESFSAIRVIKAYAREHYFNSTLKKKNETYKTAALKLASIEAFFTPAMALMVGLSVLITVWYGGKLTIDGKIEPGNITEFIWYVFRLTWPFASLGWVTSLIQRAASSQERINEFLKQSPEIVNANPKKYSFEGNITFDNVSFTYPENNITALSGLSFELKAGQTLGITGPVGSGKSSVLALLSRQYDPSAGKILIDGMALPNHNLFEYRSNCGVVPQEVFLFSDTIANNIAFGYKGKDISKEKIEAAAKQAGVYDNITSFPQQFDTMVGERGVTLSGGQKQRISIARAIINQPKFLYFDDCLSAVDSETEEMILANLKQEMKKRSSVIVSHRISSIRDCNLILVLKDGKLLEKGTHDDLLKADGAYARLFKLQNHRI